MYLGRLVEEAETATIFKNPKHPYTVALLESVLTPEPHLGIPNTQLGANCRQLIHPVVVFFHPRCAKSCRIVPCTLHRAGRIRLPMLNTTYENNETARWGDQPVSAARSGNGRLVASCRAKFSNPLATRPGGHYRCAQNLDAKRHADMV